MQTTTLDRPVVDVRARRAHPTLAFVLALLSVPGSTLAWDLPVGGYWIGLPLSVAAIVLGVQANRALHGSRLAVAAIVIAALMLGVTAVCTVLAIVS